VFSFLVVLINYDYVVIRRQTTVILCEIIVVINLLINDVTEA